MAKNKKTKKTKEDVSKKRNFKAKTKLQSDQTSLKFLKNSHSAVRSHLQASTDLPAFLDSAGSLTLNDRRRLVEQALVLIDDNFVHLPLKESMHGVDPVQKLRLIQHRLDIATSASMDSEFRFHREMIEVFTSLRDLHTNYMLPAPFADKVAFLPFAVEEYFENGEPRYICAHLIRGFSHAHFKKGVEITTWNGVPIRRAIEVTANQHAGSNSAARHTRGVDGLTVRALRRALPPDAMWAIVGYIDLNGVEREMKQEWLVTPSLPDTNGVDADALSANAASLGLDVETDIIQRAKKMFYAPKVVAQESKRQKISTHKAAIGQGVTTNMPGVFSARSVTTSSGEFGYIRIFTFSVNDPEAFIDEFTRLSGLLPGEGLIIDVRGNGGGHIHASEGLLQVLTPFEITPEPTQFINTRLNARICERHKNNPVGINLGPWVDSIRGSVETGAIYSRGFSITPRDFSNKKGQLYHGPVVLITDARCYSATDIFAAGFQDHRIGHILGVDDNTGAGGANVWTHDLLKKLLQFPAPADPETPYENLPNGAGMRVAIRRTLRVNERSGTPVEDLGVEPNSRHFLTKNDLLNGNQDLINEAGQILNQMPVRQLDISTSWDGSTLELKTTTRGITRIDVYVDGRPIESLDINDGTRRFTLDVRVGSNQLNLSGYANNEHVASRKLML